jgi:hypothetical protein
LSNPGGIEQNLARRWLEGLTVTPRARSNTRPFLGGQVAQLVEQRTENPRVGGSIPPLATIQINISNQEVASERMDSLSNISAGVQYFGPLFA